MIEILQQYWLAYLWTDGQRLSGLGMTLLLLLCTIGIGFPLSVLLAVARVSQRRALSLPVYLYTYFFRGTPLYIQLLILYSGVYSLQLVQQQPSLNQFFQDGFNCALLAFVLNTSAYTTEILAGAIRSIPHGEIEAAESFGMSRWSMYRQIILPSALRRALPNYSNEVILILHATPIAFTATVPELLKVARDVNSATYASFEAFGTAALIYAAVSFLIVWIFRQMERRWLAFLHTGSH
ncbi:histidine ABC transporter permease HisM [Vogesella facilis]|uniref:Histidine/lysine/arginine/ornithine transport system permease protein HisM n=1 Tax=Vogesella facilis TaxID=1655232 RepID=A0ABV7RHE6_9NEIS